MWLAACAGSAVLLAAVVLLVARGRAATPPPAPAAAVTGTATCDLPVPVLSRARPEAEGPPVILWAVGEVRMFLDGRATFSPPEKPRHFAVGEHVLRVEADGHPPLETKVRLDAFKPALFHAQVDEGVGVTLVRLGSQCTSCDPPLTAVSLDLAPSGEAAPSLLRAAAEALRQDAWQKARGALQAVPAADRQGPLYRRLLASFWAAAADLQQAKAAALEIHDARGEELRGLIAQLEALEGAEQARYEALVVERWNKLTEQHASLMRAATGSVDLDVNQSSHRMEQLSAAFKAAADKGAPLEKERVYLAAEKTVKALLARMISTREGDCSFRTRVAAALAGSGT